MSFLSVVVVVGSMSDWQGQRSGGSKVTWTSEVVVVCAEAGAAAGALGGVRRDSGQKRVGAEWRERVVHQHLLQPGLLLQRGAEEVRKVGQGVQEGRRAVAGLPRCRP